MGQGQRMTSFPAVPRADTRYQLLPLDCFHLRHLRVCRIFQGHLKPDYVHVLVDGSICETGYYELAKKIEEYGYNEYISKSNVIDEE